MQLNSDLQFGHDIVGEQRLRELAESAHHGVSARAPRVVAGIECVERHGVPWMYGRCECTNVVDGSRLWWDETHKFGRSVWLDGTR